MYDFLYNVSVGVVTWLACLAITYAWHALRVEVFPRGVLNTLLTCVPQLCWRQLPSDCVSLGFLFSL